jgi:hypothetical protein
MGGGFFKEARPQTASVYVICVITIVFQSAGLSCESSTREYDQWRLRFARHDRRQEHRPVQRLRHRRQRQRAVGADDVKLPSLAMH